jgi:hypothetical protein
MFLKKLFLFFVLGTIFLFPDPSLALTCQEAGGSCETDCSETLTGDYDPCPTGQLCCEVSGPTTTESGYQEGSTGGFLFLDGHIVPCGRKTNDPGTDVNETQECTLCHLFIMLKNVFDLMISLLIVAAILFITIGGIIYIVSAGNTNMTSLAKEIIKKTLIGFALMLAGWLLVYTLLVFLSAGNMLGSGGKWYEFNCDLDSSFQGTPTQIEPDDSGYTYDPGIESQLSDASEELTTLLNCMKEKLPSEAKRISSISDSAGMINCIGSNYSQPPCAHKKNSCHYGGTQCVGISYAVDFGEESYANQIEQVAQECNPGVNVYKEATHTHVSIGETNGCSCVSDE